MRETHWTDVRSNALMLLGKVAAECIPGTGTDQVC
jgi:hypothetical protein